MSAESMKFVGTIPANPGFYLLTALSDDNGYPTEVDKSPIVAWTFEEGCLAPYPITLEGVENGNVYLMLPDGSVVRPWAEKFLSADDWLSWQQIEYTKQGHGGK